MGKKFTFSGQILLRLRQQDEMSARERFVRARAEVTAIKGRISYLNTMVALHNAAAREALTGETQELNLEVYRGCMADLDAALDREEERLIEAAKVLRRRREELLEASRSAKAIRRLEERRRCEHRRAMERADVKERDDLYATHALAGGQA